jgi:tetratricopeptide (TPR) repeat protein
MTIDELYHSIYNDDASRNSNKFISIYEANRKTIENINIDSDRELHNKVMRLTADFAHHLTIKENYKKALPEIEKAIKLFEKYPKFQGTDLYKLDFYETLIFDRVTSNYHLMKLKQAQNDLNILTQKFPDNIKYKNWLAATKMYSKQKLIKILWYVTAAVILIIGFLDRQDLGVFYDLLLFLGAASLIVTLTLEILNAIVKKNIKNDG